MRAVSKSRKNGCADTAKRDSGYRMEYDHGNLVSNFYFVYNNSTVLRTR